MEDEPLNNEKRNKGSDRRKARKKYPYRKTYHKDNTPIPKESKPEESKETDEGKI